MGGTLAFAFASSVTAQGTRLSYKNILKFQSSSEDLSVFLISLGNGIKLATLLNCSVLLPTEITLCSPSPSSVPIVDIFNISKLRSQTLTRFAVDLVFESEILEHHLHLSPHLEVCFPQASDSRSTKRSRLHEHPPRCGGALLAGD
jgi:hypothetical protein